MFYGISIKKREGNKTLDTLLCHNGAGNYPLTRKSPLQRICKEQRLFISRYPENSMCTHMSGSLVIGSLCFRLPRSRQSKRQRRKYPSENCEKGTEKISLATNRQENCFARIRSLSVLPYIRRMRGLLIL